jgi:hypothetical protein
MRSHRISIGPGEVAGYFSKLKAGFEALGIESEHFAFSSNKLEYEESDYFLRTAFIKADKLRSSNNTLLKALGKAFVFTSRAIVFIYAFLRCDAFIFSGFNSFFCFYELPLLKLFGKRILVVYLGSDARPPIFSGKHLDDKSGATTPEQMYWEAKSMVGKIKRVEKYADVIVNHTATSQYFSKPFARINALGTPARSTTVPNKNARRRNDNAIRILHAPSRPLAKGSLFFKQIIKELQEEGYRISYVELIGVPNSTVLEALSECDLVLDELYSDAPMAMLAAEAATFAKPVVVGGYYANHYREDNPDIEPPPSLYVQPENIKTALKQLMDDIDYRLSIGAHAQQFVSERWNITKVAGNYLKLISGTHPADWMSSPGALAYYWGWGLSKENWLKQVNQYVDLMGERALFLDHYPRLKQMVLGELKRSKVEQAS